MNGNNKRIWVDADACPKVIKDILFRAAIRTSTPIVLVANQFLSTPQSPFIKKIQVSAGFDVADRYIIQHSHAGDLVITADISLADAVIEKGAIALNPRGEVYTVDNIKQQLSVRNFHAELRSGGLMTGGPGTLSKRDVQNFANGLEKFLTSGKP